MWISRRILQCKTGEEKSLTRCLVLTTDWKPFESNIRACAHIFCQSHSQYVVWLLYFICFFAFRSIVIRYDNVCHFPCAEHIWFLTYLIFMSCLLSTTTRVGRMHKQRIIWFVAYPTLVSKWNAIDEMPGQSTMRLNGCYTFRLCPRIKAKHFSRCRSVFRRSIGFYCFICSFVRFCS